MSYNTGMDELTQKSLDCRVQLAQIQNRRARRDLQIMLDAADKHLTELSKEAVTCRRQQRTTRQYEEIYHRAEQAFGNFEQHLFLAKLKY
jgi:hypothetical protein